MRVCEQCGEMESASDVENVLEYVEDMIQKLPSGVDEVADEDNISPQDMFAHIGGLIWQKIQTLKK